MGRGEPRWAKNRVPDFWLVECDTFWHGQGFDRVACFVIDGPVEMIRDYGEQQWLVRVEPSVTDDGVQTNRVLVDSYEPDREGTDWDVPCTGVYSVKPEIPWDWRSFSIHDTCGGHKMTATTRPDYWVAGGADD